MTFYHVSFSDKDLAKRLGAKFFFDLKLCSAQNDGVSSVMSAHLQPMLDEEVNDLRLVTGLAELKGKAEEVIAHNMNIIWMSRDEVDREIEEAFKLWKELNKSEFVLDLQVLAGWDFKYFNKTIIYKI